MLAISPLAISLAIRAPRGCATIAEAGGARRDRTDDLMLAKHALSQLSYGPVPEDECFTGCAGQIASLVDEHA